MAQRPIQMNLKGVHWWGNLPVPKENYSNGCLLSLQKVSLQCEYYNSEIEFITF